MLKTIQQEIKENKNYLRLSLILSFLTILPQFVIMDRISHFSTLFFSAVLLILLSKISRFIFLLFVLYINITNIILVHIKIHWCGDFEDRLGVALESPLYETKEYLESFIGWQDYFVIVYSIILILFTLKFILKNSYNHLYRNLKLFVTIVTFALLVKHEPFNLVSKYFSAKERANIMVYRTEFLKNEKLNYKNRSLPYNKIVVIQGESVNKNHMSLYGYKIETTPFFDKLYNEKKLYKFNVIAPSNQTRYSVPMIFSSANVEHWKDNFLNSHSLLTDFKMIGYNTYWISNQGKAGKYEDYVTSIAEEANNSIFFNQGNYSEAKSDIVMKNYLDEKIKNSKNEFYVFHLIGSHVHYEERYLKDKALFKNPKDIFQEYDNTIYFTDYIVKTIFNYFKNEKVLIIYLSDHGEVVEKRRHGHGYLPPYKDEYTIPMVMFSSIENSRIKKLQSLNKHYFNMENMDKIIKYVTYLSDDLNISYSSKIFSVEPYHKYDFKELNYYKDSLF